ncbi:MAG: hypothetical protein R3D85_03795 [Paracoccaceae bacterium]
MNIGVNYMREHMPDDARVHYAYLDAGGVAPKSVQSKAIVRQLIRARDLKGLRELVERVRKIADGAALMTETTVEVKVVSAVSNLKPNRPLEEAMQAHLDRLGAPPFDAEDRAFADRIRATLSAADIDTAFTRLGLAPDPALPLFDFVLPLDHDSDGGNGSTDVGDVSWAVPTVQARVATCAIGTALHSWQMTAHGKTPTAHKGMLHAAKVMAATARDLYERPDLLAAAQAEHKAALAREPALCLPDAGRDATGDPGRGGGGLIRPPAPSSTPSLSPGRGSAPPPAPGRRRRPRPRRRPARSPADRPGPRAGPAPPRAACR